MKKTKIYDICKPTGKNLLYIEVLVTVDSKFTRNGIIDMSKIDGVVNSFKPTGVPEKDTVSLLRKLRKSGLMVYSVEMKLSNESVLYEGGEITDIKVD
jgi:hypothetical protein